MIKPSQIPKKCLVAYQRAFKAGGGPAEGIAAAINAWPGKDLCDEKYEDIETCSFILLPLEDDE